MCYSPQPGFTNGFAGGGPGGGGGNNIGLQTGVPLANSSTDWVNQRMQPGQYMSYQTPNWISGGLYNASQPIQNIPTSAYGVWGQPPINPGSGWPALNLGSMNQGGQIPGGQPGPTPPGPPQGGSPPPPTGGPPPPNQPPPPNAPPWTGGPPPPWTGGPMPPTPGAPPVSNNPFAAFQPNGGGSRTADRVFGGVNYGPGPLSPAERGQVTNAMQQQLQSTWPGMTEQQRYAALQQNPALQGILYKHPQIGGFSDENAVKSWFGSQYNSNPGADVQRLGTQFWNR